MIVATYKNYSAVAEMLRFMVGFALLFACAQMTIPLEPVPITLQTVGVMIIALLYGMKEGMRVIVSYVVAGSLGAPVFLGYSFGPQVLFGFTGGYLVGFIVCVYCMNRLKSTVEQMGSFGMFLNCLIGTGILFAFGITWLALGMNLGWESAVIVGLLPFIISGVMKAAVLTLFLRSLGLLSGN